MSDIVRRDAGDLAPAGDQIDDPIRLLPREWRRPARFFFGFYSDLLRGQAGIATRLRMWIKKDGLTLDEAIAVMERLMEPAECAQINYVGQLLARMAGLVAEHTARRKSLEAQEERRRQSERDAATAAGPDQVRQLAAMFKTP